MAKEEKKGQLEESLEVTRKVVVGVDEVGRGCLAGPVYAAACILNWKKLVDLPADSKLLLRDSKTLSAKQRQKALLLIKEIAVDFAISKSSPREIEELGIVFATFLAMRRSLEALSVSYDHILVDGRDKIKGLSFDNQQALIKGDQRTYVISCASILAKEKRDLVMRKQAQRFPGYGFDSHVGYGTKKHLEALKDLGPCDLHRKNFAPITLYGRPIWTNLSSKDLV